MCIMQWLLPARISVVKFEVNCSLHTVVKILCKNMHILNNGYRDNNYIMQSIIDSLKCPLNLILLQNYATEKDLINYRPTEHP